MKSRRASSVFVNTLLLKCLLLLTPLLLLEGLIYIANLSPLLDLSQGTAREGRNTFIPGEGEQRGQWLTSPDKLRFINEQSFTKLRKPNSLRIVCLGGSTTYGRPYSDSVSFSGWLREYLTLLMPQQTVEVINAGGISYASSRALKLMQEMIHHKPDWFIIYSGHNEFLEERSEQAENLLTQTAAFMRTKLGWSKTFQFTDQILRTHLDVSQQTSENVETLLDRSIGLDAYTRNDPLHAKIHQEYRENLNSMVNMAQSAGAQVVLITPASSLRNCRPFKSEALPRNHEEAIEQALMNARFHTDKGELASAEKELRSAVKIAPRHALTLYRLADNLLAQQKAAEAKTFYRKAKDEDIVTLRAPSSFIDTLREVATQHNVALIDFQSIAQSWTKAKLGHAIPGAELFLDHVHPTPDGHGLIAKELVQLIHRPGASNGQMPNSESGHQVRTIVLDRIDHQQEGLSFRNLAKVLSWAGKNDEAVRHAQKAMELIGRDAECLFILALHAEDQGDEEQAISLLSEAVDLDPNYIKALNNLSILLSRNGQHQKAIKGYKHILSLHPEHPNAPYNLSKAYLRIKDYEAAYRLLKKCIKEKPEDQDAWYYLGVSAENTGRKEEAIKAFRQTLDLDPTDKDAAEKLDELLQLHEA